MPYPDNPYLAPEPVNVADGKTKPSMVAMAVILVVCFGFALFLAPADPLSFCTVGIILAILGLSSYLAGHAHGSQRER